MCSCGDVLVPVHVSVRGFFLWLCSFRSLPPSVSLSLSLPGHVSTSCHRSRGGRRPNVNAWKMTGTNRSGELRLSEGSTLELCTFEVQKRTWFGKLAFTQMTLSVWYRRTKGRHRMFRPPVSIVHFWHFLVLCWDNSILVIHFSLCCSVLNLCFLLATHLELIQAYLRSFVLFRTAVKKSVFRFLFCPLHQ